MKQLSYEVKWFFTPLIISFVVLILDKTTEYSFISAITLFVKQVLVAQTTIQVIQFSFILSMLVISIKLIRRTTKKFGQPDFYTMPGYVISLISPFTMAMAILSGFMIAEALLLITAGDRSGYFLVGWGMYVVLGTFSFLLIIDNALQMHHLSKITINRSNYTNVTKAVGWLFLLITLTMTYWTVYENYITHGG